PDRRQGGPGGRVPERAGARGAAVPGHPGRRRRCAEGRRRPAGGVRLGRHRPRHRLLEAGGGRPAVHRAGPSAAGPGPAERPGEGVPPARVRADRHRRRGGRTAAVDRGRAEDAELSTEGRAGTGGRRGGQADDHRAAGEGTGLQTAQELAPTHPAGIVAARDRDPARIAVRFPEGDGWSTWTRDDLAAAVGRRVDGLRRAGLRPGDRVGVVGPTTVDWLAAGYAVQAAGGVLVGAYPTSAPGQLRYVFGHSGCRIVFAATV